MAKRTSKKKTNNVEQLLDLYKDNIETITCGYENFSFTVNVRKHISLKERAEMIDSIASMCYKDGIYAPYLFDFAIGYAKVKYYTDIELPQCFSQSDADYIDDSTKVWDFLVVSDIESKIDSVINDFTIGTEASDLIEYRKQEFLTHTSFDKLLNSATTFIDGINKIVVNDAGEYNLNDFMKLLKNITSKDEGKIVDAILDYNEEHKEDNKE